MQTSTKTLIGYCNACGRDAEHRVVGVDSGGRIVECVACDCRGPYLEPRGVGEERERVRAPAGDLAEIQKLAGSKRARDRPEKVHAQITSDIDSDEARPYAPSVALAPGDAVLHPRFGLGLVFEVPEPGKARLFFRSGERLLKAGARQSGQPDLSSHGRFT